MIHNIREAFTEILEDSDWMDDATKGVAKEKVCFTLTAVHLFLLNIGGKSSFIQTITKTNILLILIHMYDHFIWSVNC